MLLCLNPPSVCRPVGAYRLTRTDREALEVGPGIVAISAGARVGDAAPATTPKSRMSPMFMSGHLSVVTLDPTSLRCCRRG